MNRMLTVAGAAVLVLGAAQGVRAQEGTGVENPFFNPFSISRPSSSPSWLTFFSTPAASSNPLRGATLPPVQLPSPTTSSPLAPPVAAAGPPPKSLPFRSPYSPPPRNPFGP